MEFDVEERESAIILTLKGNVLGGPDGTSLHDRLYALKEKGLNNVVADCSEVRFVNSSGLGMMIGAMTTMRNAGGDFRLANVADGIRSLLMITGLVRVFKHYESIEAALESYEDDPPKPVDG